MLNIPDRINSRYHREKKKSLATETFESETWRGKKNKKKGITTSVSSVHPREKTVKKYLRNKDQNFFQI